MKKLLLILALLLSSCIPAGYATTPVVAPTQTVVASPVYHATTARLVVASPPVLLETATICGGSVNLRSSPTRQSRWLAVIGPGETVRIIHRGETWVYVGYKKHYGYITSGYVCEGGKR